MTFRISYYDTTFVCNPPELNPSSLVFCWSLSFKYNSNLREIQKKIRSQNIKNFYFLLNH